MAALDFPTPSDVGETYTANNVVYVWTGSYWDAQIEINSSAAFVPLSGGVTMTGSLGATQFFTKNNGDGKIAFEVQNATATNLSITTKPDITISNPCDIKIAEASGLALRIIDGTSEMFRFNTSTEVADFTCDVKLDGGVELATPTVTVSQDTNILIPNSSSNALDIVPSDATTTFGLRFNTNAQQLITDYDFVNDNNDGVIQLGGTTANPLLKLTGDGSADFANGVASINNEGRIKTTKHFYTNTGNNNNTAIKVGKGSGSGSVEETWTTFKVTTDGEVHIGTTTTASATTPVHKLQINEVFAGNTGGLVIKGRRPNEALNGVQSILDIHYQDVATGSDIRYYGAVGNANSLQNKTSVNGLIDNKLNPSAITSNSTSVTLKQPTTTDSTLTMGGNLLPASSSIDIGTQSSKFNNIYVSQINDTGDLVVSGDIFLGNNALDTLSMRAAIITSLSSSSTSNTIGSSTAPWGTIYTAKSVQAGIDSTSHSAHISMNEDGSLKLRNLTGLSQLTVTPSTGLLAMISNKLYIYIATGWKEVNLTAATPPS